MVLLLYSFATFSMSISRNRLVNDCPVSCPSVMYTVYTTSIFSSWKKKHKSNLRLIVVLALYSTSLQKNLTPFFVALDQYVLCMYHCTMYMCKEKSNLHFFCCPRPVHVHCTCLKKNLTSIFIVARVKRQ